MQLFLKSCFMHVCFGPDPDLEHCSAETSNEKLLTLNCSQFQERFRLLVYLSVHYFLSMPGNIGKAVALFRFSQTTLEKEVIFYIAPIPFKVASARIYSSLLSRHPLRKGYIPNVICPFIHVIHMLHMALK